MSDPKVLPLDWFQEKQKERMALPKNMAKGNNWLNDTSVSLWHRISDQQSELAGALSSGDPEKIIKECANIANFAAMIAHKQKVRLEEIESESDKHKTAVGESDTIG